MRSMGIDGELRVAAAADARIAAQLHLSERCRRRPDSSQAARSAQGNRGIAKRLARFVRANDAGPATAGCAGHFFELPFRERGSASNDSRT